MEISYKKYKELQEIAKETMPDVAERLLGSDENAKKPTPEAKEAQQILKEAKVITMTLGEYRELQEIAKETMPDVAERLIGSDENAEKPTRRAEEAKRLLNEVQVLKMTLAEYREEKLKAQSDMVPDYEERLFGRDTEAVKFSAEAQRMLQLLSQAQVEITRAEYDALVRDSSVTEDTPYGELLTTAAAEANSILTEVNLVMIPERDNLAPNLNIDTAVDNAINSGVTQEATQEAAKMEKIEIPQQEAGKE